MKKSNIFSVVLTLSLFSNILGSVSANSTTADIQSEIQKIKNEDAALLVRTKTTNI